MSAGLDLGMGLLVAGLVLILLVWVMVRVLPYSQSEPLPRADPWVQPEIIHPLDAVVIVKHGGRVEHLNALARTYFNLHENEPYDLERLARRTRPMDDFLNLCTNPGKKKITINGKPAEVTSYRLPGVYQYMLVSLREAEPSPALAKQGDDTSSAILRLVTEFGQAVTARPDIHSTMLAILENVSRLVPCDVLELKLWDEETQTFIPYRIHESVSEANQLTRAQSQFGHLTTQLVARREAILIANTRSQPQLLPTGELSPVNSYIGLPLMAGGELIGLLETGQVGSGAFGQQDLTMLQLIAGQAAIAIRNAKFYEEEQKRVAELSGLVNLNQSFGAVKDPSDLFSRLVESITPLFDVDIVGFLLYDEEKRTLEGQVPFHGLPPHFVERYRASIPADSPAERVLTSQQPVLTMNAVADDNWQALGLTDIAIAASLRDSAFIPLISSGRTLGFMHVGHHRRGPTSFTTDELRLMNIVASQAAAIIENALLIQQAKARAQRANALRRITSLATSSATLDETLKYSMQELAHLFQADVGAVFLMDESRGELLLRRASLFGVAEETAHSFPSIYLDDPSYHLTVSGSRQPFISWRLSTDRRAHAIYRPLAPSLHLESLVVVPLLVREQSIGELMLGSRATDYFNDYDLQVIFTAAGQLAAAVDTAGLMSQTDETLRRRVHQLTSIARVSRELNISLEVRQLLQVFHDEGLRAIRAECGCVLLLEQESGAADPRVAMRVGCSQAGALSLLERMVIQKGTPLVVSDFAHESHFPPHEGVRSAIITPLSHQGRVIGVVHFHASQPAYFMDDAVETVQTLARHVAIAINNAQRYQTERTRAEFMRRHAETLARVKQVSYSLSSDQPLEQALQAVAQGIQDSTPFRVVLISLYEPDSGLLRRLTGTGIPQDTLNELLSRKQPLASIQQLMKPEFKISRSYFIPADQTPVIPADVHTVTFDQPASNKEPSSASWDPDDFLLIPLEDVNGEMLGLISLDKPSNGLRPDRVTIEAIEVFAMQATLILSNARHIDELSSRVDSLTAAIQRQQKLLSVTQNDLPILLRKDLEQTVSMHNLDRRAQRVRAGLAITESVSRQLDASSALMALGRETLTQLGMSVALVAENTAEGPRLLHVLGSLPRSTNAEALFGQRNPLRACLQSGKPILVANLDENEEWRDVPLLTALRTKGMICLPVTVEQQPVAAMLAVSPEPLTAFTDEDIQVYYQISRQTSVILQNITLLNDTRRHLQEVNLLLDFSRQLSGLDPDAIVQALLESTRRVLPAAHAGTVLIWNPQAEILTPRAVFGYADNDTMLKIAYRAGEALPGMTFSRQTTRRVDEINFASDYNLSTENLAIYREATGGRLPISSLLVPIMAGEQNLGLLVLDNFNTTSVFKPTDEALLLSLTQQVALSLENVRLMQATQERAGQLQALNTAAASLTSSMRIGELIKSLLDQLATILPYDTATLWLREKDRLIVSSARGFTDNEQRLGLAISVSDSALFQEMTQTGQTIYVGDVRADRRFPALEAPRLSWLGIPLISKGELAGVLALEKWQAHFYSREQLQVALTFASQCAVSLDNARLYEDSLSRAAELDQRSQRLALLNRFSSSLSGLLDTDQILQLTANELLTALGVKRVSVVTFERGQALLTYVTPRGRHRLPRLLQESPIFNRLRESLGIFNTDDACSEPDLVPLTEMLDETTALLILSLAGGTRLSGLVFAHLSGEGRFGLNEIELARTICNQAAIALENARLYQSTVKTAERLAIINETSSQINASLDPEQIYAAVHKAAQRLMPLESFVISLLDETSGEIEGVYLVDHDKRAPAMRIPHNKGLSGRIISSGQPLLIHGGDKATETGGITLGGPDTPPSILAVPMILGSKVLGMLSAQSHQLNVYTEEDQQILSTLANQAIVAIQNGRLFAETQRLAQELEQRVIERTAQLQREQHNTETLLRILTDVSSSLDLDRALNRTLSLLNDAIGAEQGTIMLHHEDDNLLHYRAGYGYLSERLEPKRHSFTLKVGEGLAGWVVQNRTAALIDDLHADPRWVRASAAGQDHRSAIVVPLMIGEDVIGVLMVFHRTVRFFSAEMLNLVKAIASQVAMAINNARLYELIRDQAERLGVMLRKEQEEASRSQAILAAVADGVLVTGPNNRITFVNSSTERILSLQASRVLGSSLEEFVGLFGKAAHSWMNTIKRWSESPATHHPGDTYAEQIELENGKIALVHLAPVIFQNDFLGTVSIFRDITHEVEVDRLKSEFVATVSHELRTPMTSIKGYIDILMMGAAGALNENQAHFLDIIRNNIDRLNILVSDLLDISRLESGRVTLAPQPVDLREVAEDVIHEVLRRSQDENKPMALSLDAPKNVPLVLGDVELIHQILSNLIHNAYNYTPGNGTIRIAIHTPNGSEVQVDVQDNGVGVPEEDQQRIFDRFYRGENPLVLATPGTGLGLSIVRQLVEMHNGRIWMHSTGVPGEGSTFSFTVPVYK